jgi:glycosyltransferase involved in cell wall biosynthesis
MNSSISIIICTRNRAERLRSTLQSIGKVTVPKNWIVELLVVDNGSTDGTDAVVMEARLSNMNLRYISEPMPGQSHARNTGLRETSGAAILFTDDDIRVPSNWVVAMCEPILTGVTQAVAGAIVFPGEYRGAFSRPGLSSRQSWFASTHELDLHHPGRMVGANMAFHRRVLDKCPKFDVELGPGALGFGDETLFSFQLLAAGYKLVAVFDASVEHYFDLTRLTRGALMDAARKMGRSRAFIFHHWEHKRSRLVFPRLMLCRWRRYWAQRSERNHNKLHDNIPDRLLELEQELAFYREYIVQRRRAFKYPLRGLAPMETK